jgi:predicted TIM-barrel fold metal-dependent hydrolase
LSNDQEKNRELEDVPAITAIPSESDQLMSEMVLSLQGASIPSAVINTVVTDLTDSLTAMGEVAVIQTLTPRGHQLVRILEYSGHLISFKFPDPNRVENLLSEFQRAQNNKLVVRVKYSPVKENFIKSLEVLGVSKV